MEKGAAVVGTVVDAAAYTVTLPYYSAHAVVDTMVDSVGMSGVFQSIFGKGTIDTTDAGLEKLFSSIDKDASGTLTTTEMELAIMKMYGEVDEALVQKMMKSADTNQDGVLSLAEFKTIMRAQGALRYTAIACGESTSYFLRSDGGVDETRWGGKVEKRYPRPSADVAYIGVTAGGAVGTDNFLRSDGKVFQRGCFTNAVVSPPAGVKYVQVDTGEHNDYFLRDDGVIDRGRHNGFKPIDAPGMKFVQMAAGTMHSYFLRDDGIVIRTHGGGSISRELGDPNSDVLAGKYVSVGSQGTVMQTREMHGSYHHYLIRADGVCTRTGVTGSEGKSFNPPRGTKYIDCSVNEFCAYLLRSDGCVDREQMGSIQNTMNPPPGTKYTSVSANRYCSYFLRSDGKVDRTEGGGIITQAGLTATDDPINKGWS